ncbi:MAG TPA: cytochrome c oxidase subunit II [Anaerolineae bacterium]|nr:cytochrome c oxidase subunit II [Anaerolineae bacterium]HMR66763.1 cytochrome c oxidase subunit II [Anaerolineae bacterium]
MSDYRTPATPHFATFITLFWLSIVVLPLLSSCSSLSFNQTKEDISPSIFNPQGPAANMVANLSWLMFGLAGAVFLLVMGVLILGLVRSRPDVSLHESNPAQDRRFIVFGGLLLPAVVLGIVYVSAIWTMRALAAPAEADEIVIEIVGHQYWWEIHYPDFEVTTANEIHLPAGQPVRLRVTSADVIHSFWVPELHGKIDLIPGQVNGFWLQADEPGIYLGLCAEFCGVQHAKMLLRVVAEPPERFAAWLEHQAEPAAAVTGSELEEGQQVFFNSGCMNCHTVRGTNASGTEGPDLTHLASRLTLAAGVLENNRGNLGGWVVNPQHLKPGNHMPPSALTGLELQALLTYLESLE